MVVLRTILKKPELFSILGLLELDILQRAHDPARTYSITTMAICTQARQQPATIYCTCLCIYRFFQSQPF